MAGYRHIQGIFLDAGGVLLDTAPLRISAEAEISFLTNYLKSQGSKIHTDAVRHMFLYAKQIANMKERIGTERLVRAVCHTALSHCYEMESGSGYDKFSALLSEFEIHLGQDDEKLLPSRERDVVKSLKRLKEKFGAIGTPSMYPEALQFLNYLKKNEIPYVIITNAPHEPNSIRSQLANAGIDPQRVIPSQELGVLKNQSSLFYMAACVLLYGGWSYYSNIVLGNLDKVHAAISEPSDNNLENLSQLLEVGKDIFLSKFSKTVGLFNDPSEHLQAQNLGIWSFLCNYQGRAEIDAGWFGISDIGSTTKKIESLEQLLDKNPQLTIDEVKMQHVDR